MLEKCFIGHHSDQRESKREKISGPITRGATMVAATWILSLQDTAFKIYLKFFVPPKYWIKMLSLFGVAVVVYFSTCITDIIIISSWLKF